MRSLMLRQLCRVATPAAYPAQGWAAAVAGTRALATLPVRATGEQVAACHRWQGWSELTGSRGFATAPGGDGREAAAAAGGEAAAPAAASSSFIPSWLRSKLPAAIGGSREYEEEVEQLTMDKYASTLRQARQLGGLSELVPGARSMTDPVQKGNLRLYEEIIKVMTEGEKADLRTFGVAGRQRVSLAAKCTVAQVDDCVAKYLWMRQMLAGVAESKREGKPLPKSIEDMEQSLGHWRKFKSSPEASGRVGESEPNPNAATVPVNSVSARGQPCPLAGKQASRNTKCPLTKKNYKQCCGRAKL